MPFHVCNTATLKCDFAVPPGISTFVVLPIHRMITSDQPAANINDHVPMTNVMPFGMCMSPGNPAFVSATALDNVSTLQCMLGGTITILYPGEVTEMIP